jgi:hypothetical protein
MLFNLYDLGGQIVLVRLYLTHVVKRSCVLCESEVQSAIAITSRT